MKSLLLMTLFFSLLTNSALAKGRKRPDRPTLPPVTPAEIVEETEVEETQEEVIVDQQDEVQEGRFSIKTIDKVAGQLYQNLQSSELIQSSAGEQSKKLANLMFELCMKSPAGKNYRAEQLQVYCLIPLDLRICTSPMLLKGKSLREAFNECDVEYKTGSIPNLYEAVQATMIEKKPEFTYRKLESAPQIRSEQEAAFIVVLYDALDLVIENSPAYQMLEGEEWLDKQLPEMAQ